MKVWLRIFGYTAWAASLLFVPLAAMNTTAWYAGNPYAALLSGLAVFLTGTWVCFLSNIVAGIHDRLEELTRESSS